MNILQIVSSSATSGGERHVFQLSERLQAQGHNVIVVCPVGGWLNRELDGSGLEVVQIDMKGAGWLRTLFAVNSIVKNRNIDLIHSHLTRAAYIGSVCGASRRIPTIATVHIANHDQIYKRMARGRNRLIAVSNYVRGLLDGRGIPSKFVETVYNGTDFIGKVGNGGRECLERLGVPCDSKVVGVVGRVSAQKGQIDLVRSMKSVLDVEPTAHIVCVGQMEDAFEPEIRAEVSSCGLESKVTFAGVQRDVPALMDAFAVSAVPSRKETFGLAAIEAMARGRALVATQVGGLPEIVDHGQNGLLVRPDPNEISAALIQLLSDPALCAKMGERGKRLVEERFTLSRMTNEILGVYSRALGD